MLLIAKQTKNIARTATATADGKRVENIISVLR